MASSSAASSTGSLGGACTSAATTATRSSRASTLTSPRFACTPRKSIAGSCVPRGSNPETVSSTRERLAAASFADPLQQTDTLEQIYSGVHAKSANDRQRWAEQLSTPRCDANDIAFPRPGKGCWDTFLASSSLHHTDPEEDDADVEQAPAGSDFYNEQQSDSSGGALLGRDRGGRRPRAHLSWLSGAGDEEHKDDGDDADDQPLDLSWLAAFGQSKEPPRLVNAAATPAFRRAQPCKDGSVPAKGPSKVDKCHQRSPRASRIAHIQSAPNIFSPPARSKGSRCVAAAQPSRDSSLLDSRSVETTLASESTPDSRPSKLHEGSTSAADTCILSPDSSACPSAASSRSPSPQPGNRFSALESAKTDTSFSYSRLCKSRLPAPLNRFVDSIRQQRGSILRAWQLDFDLHKDGRVTKAVFATACRNLGFHTEVRQLWQALRPNGELACIRMHELDEDEASAAQTFSEMLWQHVGYGKMSKAWALLDVGSRFFANLADFSKLAAQIAFVGDAKLLFQGLDVRGHGQLRRQDLEYLMVFCSRPRQLTSATPLTTQRPSLAAIHSALAKPRQSLGASSRNGARRSPSPRKQSEHCNRRVSLNICPLR